MAEWPVHLAGSGAINVNTSDTAAGTTLTSSGSANTKGSYAEVVASTPRGCSGIHIGIRQITANRAHLTDIAIGAASSEQIIMENLQTGPNQAGMIIYYYLPVPIPAGSRIAARTQSSNVSSTVSVSVTPVFGSLLNVGSPHIVTYGANTSDSGGAEIDTGGSANTRGSWTEITAATTERLQAIAFNVGGETNPVNAAPATATFLLDVGVGAAASEQTVIEGFRFASSSTADSYMADPAFWWPVDIPEGSRIAVRGSSSSTDATDRIFDCVLYGLAA